MNPPRWISGSGRFRSAVIHAIVMALATGWIGLPTRAALPFDFQSELVATGFVIPISMAFHPDGRLLVIEKDGRVEQVLPGSGVPDPVPYLQLVDVESSGERGLFGIVLDPDFGTNGYMYLYYTHASTALHRISRFREVAGLADPTSEFVVWQDSQPWTGIGHIGGGIAFGLDGNIYLATGDESDGAQAQDLTQSGGKIIRIGPDGSIPLGNPFDDGPGPQVDSIWAVGLRNPFKATYDLVTGRYFVGDVGQDTLEEIHEGSPGANFAWALCEGPNCGPQFSDPVHFYPHSVIGGAVTVGPVYRGLQFPPIYRGALFYADFVQNWIRYLTFDPSGNVSGSFDFDTDAQRVVFLGEGLDGSLYTLQLAANRFDGEVRRIRFGSPVPTISLAEATSPTQGDPPLAVRFVGAALASGAGSLQFEWIFGDGQSALAANVTHVYTTRGQYTAQLRVTEGSGTTLSAPIAIAVGAPPVAKISSPSNGSSFRADDVILLSASATDPDEVLGPNAFEWSFEILHDQHAHPMGQPIAGSLASLRIPISGHDFNDETAIQITLTVTDSDGLTNVKTVVIEPSKVLLRFDSVPSNLDLVLDGITRRTPFVRNSLIGFEHGIEASGSQCLPGAGQHVFDGWSDGGAAAHTIKVPSTGQNYYALFGNVGLCPRVQFGQQALYRFDEGSGTQLTDTSGVFPPLNLSIADPANVVWIPGGGLSIVSPTVITSAGPASRLTTSLSSAGALSVETWMTPANVVQDGPARVVALSIDPVTPSNFVLGQGRFGALPSDVIDFRLRTRQLPGSVTTPPGSVTAKRLHVVYTRSPLGDVSIYLDAVLQSAALQQGALDNWDPAAVLGLANEPTGDRPWLGTLDLVSIYDRQLSPQEVMINFEAGPHGVSPPLMECSDGIDNDGDGGVDFPSDPGCTGPNDPSENQAVVACDNWVDDDLDGLVDFPADPECTSSLGSSEVPEPGLGGFLIGSFLLIASDSWRRYGASARVAVVKPS